MMLATLLQEKCEEVYWENITKDSIRKKCTAILAVMISGAIDGAVIAYPFMLISSMIDSHQLAKLRKYYE